MQRRLVEKYHMVIPTHNHPKKSNQGFEGMITKISTTLFIFQEMHPECGKTPKLGRNATSPKNLSNELHRLGSLHRTIPLLCMIWDSKDRAKILSVLDQISSLTFHSSSTPKLNMKIKFDPPKILEISETIKKLKHRSR